MTIHRWDPSMEDSEVLLLVWHTYQGSDGEIEDLKAEFTAEGKLTCDNHWWYE